MKIYVAGAWSERARVREIMNLLMANGHTITHNWTHEDQFNLYQAATDKQAVLSADALVFLAENEYASSGGALTELGIAIGLGKPVYILGTGIDKNIFTLLPQVHRGIDILLKTKEICYTSYVWG